MVARVSAFGSTASEIKVGLHKQVGARIYVDQRNMREHVQCQRFQNVRSDASTLPGDSQANFGCLFAFLPVSRTCEDSEVATLGFEEADRLILPESILDAWMNALEHVLAHLLGFAWVEFRCGEAFHHVAVAVAQVLAALFANRHEHLAVQTHAIDEDPIRVHIWLRGSPWRGRLPAQAEHHVCEARRAECSSAAWQQPHNSAQICLSHTHTLRLHMYKLDALHSLE